MALLMSGRCVDVDVDVGVDVAVGVELTLSLVAAIQRVKTFDSVRDW